jgi:hypothetical protein
LPLKIIKNRKKLHQPENLQVQQTPNPEAHVPADVPLLDVHSELKMSTKMKEKRMKSKIRNITTFL